MGGCGACRGSDQAQMWRGLGSNQSGEGVEEGNSCTAERVLGGCWKSVLPLWRTVGSFSEGEKG